MEDALVFGRDVVFTYGPYGFSRATSPSGDVRGHLDLRGARAVVATVVWGIVRAHGSRRGCASAGRSRPRGDVRLGGPAELLPASRSSSWFSWSLERRGDAPAAVSTSGCSTVCNTLALSAQRSWSASVVPVVVVAADLVRRRTFRIVATWSSVVAFWLLAGQPTSALGDYVSSSSGSSPDTARAWRETVRSGACCSSRRIHRRPLAPRPRVGSAAPRRIRLTCSGSPLLFLVFKTGFVRFDPPHAMLSTSGSLVGLTAGSPVSRRARSGTRSPQPWRHRAALRAGFQHRAEGPGSVPDRVPRRCLMARAGAAAGRDHGLPVRVAPRVGARGDPPARSGTAPTGKRRRRASLGGLALRRLDTDLDRLPEPARSPGLQRTPSTWEARVRQVLVVHRAELDRLPVPVDGRRPLVAAHPPLLGQGVAAKHLLLRKLGSPRAVSWTPLPSGRNAFGRAMSLGPRKGTALWVVIDVRPTWLLRGAGVHHPPVLSLTLRTSSGEMQGYRLVPGIARASSSCRR